MAPTSKPQVGLKQINKSGDVINSLPIINFCRFPPDKNWLFNSMLSVLKLSDKISVIHKGKLSKIMNAEEVTSEKLGILMGGANWLKS